MSLTPKIAQPALKVKWYLDTTYDTYLDDIQSWRTDPGALDTYLDGLYAYHQQETDA